eukprot:1059135-Karenia_brevis.AAC.1
MPENSPQGHGSPLVGTMAQASLYAMKNKLEHMAKLEMVTQDPKTNAAVVSSSTARLIQMEYDTLGQARQH